MKHNYVLKNYFEGYNYHYKSENKESSDEEESVDLSTGK